jgi:hypothetical protein
MSKCKLILLMTVTIMATLVSLAQSQINPVYVWTSLDGPYWTNAIDVAYGKGGYNYDWHRYLVGSDGNVSIISFWNSSETKWFPPQMSPTESTNKVISYRAGDAGHIAFCSAFENNVYKTGDGGATWDGICNFEVVTNTQFSALDVWDYTDYYGSMIYVGCRANASNPTVFKGELVSGNWNWSLVGSTGFVGHDVNDLEFPPTGDGSLFAATDNGLYKKAPEQEDWVTRGLTGYDITCIEPLDYHVEMWAAGTYLLDQSKHLYYSSDASNNQFSEILIYGQPFEKDVMDIAAIHINIDGDKQAIYIAGDDGLYLLTCEMNGFVRGVIDFQQEGGLTAASPFRYDHHVKSLDYYQSAVGADTRQILVGTENNVFLVEETRDMDTGDIESFKFTDVSKGAFISNVAAASLPVNSSTSASLFTNSNNGIVKNYYKDENSDGWEFKALAYDAATTAPLNGTDISSDFSDESYDNILVSASDDEIGAVMLSDDGGASWSASSPPDNVQFPVNAVSLDRAVDPPSGYAYAAGTSSYLWWSGINGASWNNSTTSFVDPLFNDVLADQTSSGRAFACGSGNVKAVMSTNYGINWTTIENGLLGVDDLNELAIGGNAITPVPWLYAATSSGVFKYDLEGVTQAWSARTYGIGSPTLSTITIDSGDPYALLTATAPYVVPPHIWASGDSGRSWIEIPLGQIPSDAAINQITASDEHDGGFIASTNQGTFYIGDIFKKGDILASTGGTTWGPGVVIVNGDVMIRPDAPVTIQGPCTVFFTYCFDTNDLNGDPGRAVIKIHSGSTFHAIGGPDERIVFTSSRPDGKTAGDWGGFVSQHSSNITLQYCDIEYAYKGFYDLADVSQQYINILNISNCTFSNLSTAGIDLKRSTISSPLTIQNSTFSNCGQYGILVRQDDVASLARIDILKNEIIDCGYGIWYNGSGNANSFRKLNIYDCIIRRTTLGGYFGIYASKFTGIGTAPIIDLQADSIAYFLQGGICLNNVASSSTLMENKVKRNGTYGLRLINSSPSIGSQMQQDYNAFCFNNYGISCDKYSNPKVRASKIKENSLGGVQIESHTGPSVPDFGISPDNGNNSINTQSPAPGYYDMRNYSPTAIVRAEGNWWGEAINPSPILGLVDYNPFLLSDPLPAGNERRDHGNSILPDVVTLEQNYPNPFNPSTSIAFRLEEPCYVDLSVYNIAGQLVKTILADHLGEGRHTLIWDGINSGGTPVCSGIYFYVLRSEFGQVSKSMSLIR